MMLPEPFDLDLDDFLKGIGQTKHVDIDFIFSGLFEEFWEENHGNIEPAGRHLKDDPVVHESDVVDGVKYLSVDDGIIMVDKDYTPIGCYLWYTLCISKQWQRLGLGRELVIVRCTQDGRNPVWDADNPAYSPAGFAAHRSAWLSFR